MSYTNKTQDIWGCFRCGAFKPEFEVTPSGWGKCLTCCEYGIVTLEAALDYMNNQYTAGYKVVREPIPELEDIEAAGFPEEQE